MGEREHGYSQPDHDEGGAEVDKNRLEAERKLGEWLIQKGFRQAGQWEVKGPVGSQKSEIPQGRPMTWGYNNGTIAVYDRYGIPWVARGTADSVLEAFGDHLDGGAHVPHSSDNGDWIEQRS